MWTDAYVPTWVSIECEKQTRAAITFTTNKDSSQFARDLSIEHVVDHVVQARGKNGPCWEYLFRTMNKLRALSIEEPHLHSVSELAKAQMDTG